MKKLAILNAGSVIVVIALSYYSQTFGINGNTIAAVSDKYENLFTPAGYAFGIWGLIFFGLLAFSAFQLYQVYGPGKYPSFLRKTGYWFFAANLANIAWIFAWLYEFAGLSVILMFLLVYFLVKVVLNTNMERWDAPLPILAFQWWPICLYFGWINVAAIANVAAYQVKIEWTAPFFSEKLWTVLLIAVATAINIAIIYLRNMREFAAVGVWALVGIYFRHFYEFPIIAYSALLGAVVIFSNIIYHAWINRKSNPLFRLFGTGKKNFNQNHQ